MGKVLYPFADGTLKEIEFDDKHSLKDYTAQVSVDVPDNVSVYASCFSCETPDAVIFRDKMTGVTFYNCNLDNCLIPQGNKVIGGSQRRFELQNDLRDWMLDDQNMPLKLVNEKFYEKEGYPITVDSIPQTFIRRETMYVSQYEDIKDDENFLQWWKGDITLEKSIKTIAVTIKEAELIEMKKSGHFSPFNAEPKIELFLTANVPDKAGNVSDETLYWATGEVDCVTASGESLVKIGTSTRKCDNEIEDLLK